MKTFKKAPNNAQLHHLTGRTHRPCSSSNQMLPSEEFYKASSHRNGWLDHEGVRRRARCRSCVSVESKAKRQAGIRSRNHAAELITAAKRRARIKGVLFNLEPGDISIPRFCPVLGIQLVRNEHSPKDNSPAIDRIIPELGYVKGNVMVVSGLANRVKTNATPDVLRKVADYYEQLLLGKRLVERAT